MGKGKEKQPQKQKPVKLSDFRGNPPRVTPTLKPKDPGDIESTKFLMEAYSDQEGFHCPVCGLLIEDGDQAVTHLSEEINAAMDKVSKMSRPQDTGV